MCVCVATQINLLTVTHSKLVALHVHQFSQFNPNYPAFISSFHTHSAHTLCSVALENDICSLSLRLAPKWSSRQMVWKLRSLSEFVCTHTSSSVSLADLRSHTLCSTVRRPTPSHTCNLHSPCLSLQHLFFAFFNFVSFLTSDILTKQYYIIFNAKEDTQCEHTCHTFD